MPAIGQCKVCAWKHARELNKRLNQGWTEPQLREWAEGRTPPLTWNRKTLYDHRDNHAQHPADALVSYAQRAVDVSVATVTTSEFLDSVKNIAMQRAMDNPELITIDHGLKAAALLDKRSDRSEELLFALAKVMLGKRVTDVVEVIDGQAVEIN